MSGPEMSPPLATPPSVSMEEDPVALDDLHWSDGLVLLVFWALFAVVFLQFFTRYVLNDSLGWTEEIARYLLILVTFIGCVMVVRKQSHIAVEIFYRWIPRRLRRLCQTAVDLMALGFYGVMIVTCARLAMKTRQKMVSIDVPKAALYWGVTLCFSCMFVLAAWVLIRHLRTGTSALIDPPRPDAGRPVPSTALQAE